MKDSAWSRMAELSVKDSAIHQVHVRLAINKAQALPHKIHMLTPEANMEAIGAVLLELTAVAERLGFTLEEAADYYLSTLEEVTEQ